MNSAYHICAVEKSPIHSFYAAVIIEGTVVLEGSYEQCKLFVTLMTSHDQIVEALKLAFYELNAIRARDGAPQHIDWDRGRPLQTDSCTHEWFSEVVDKCKAALEAAGER